jgi:uridylate kinase
VPKIKGEIKRWVVSVGGSLLVPDEIGVGFIRDFKDLVNREISLGKQFVIVTGGGQTSRAYQHAAREIKPEITDLDLDWVGLHATRLNGEFLRILFGDEAYYKVVTDPAEVAGLEGEELIIGAGWKPGRSSDYITVCLAENIGAEVVVNLSNIKYVYSEDPKVNPNAERFEKLSWGEYLKLIPNEWEPKLSTPFDPIASKKAKESGLDVVLAAGGEGKIENLEKLFAGEEFDGTLLHP